jgi:hypothetical protein
MPSSFTLRVCRGREPPTSGAPRTRGICMFALPHPALLLPRCLPTVGRSVGRAAGDHKAAKPHTHAISTSAAGRQRRSVYRGSIALPSSSLWERALGETSLVRTITSFPNDRVQRVLRVLRSSHRAPYILYLCDDWRRGVSPTESIPWRPSPMFAPALGTRCRACYRARGSLHPSLFLASPPT